MFHGIPVKSDFQIVEMIPGRSGKALEYFPAGAIAQAWLDVHSRQLTWDDLTRWLEACPRL